MLHASSDAVDTDFVAKLVDVLSRRVELQHGRGHPARALSREPQPPQPLTPGQVYRFEIDLVGTSVAFQKGTASASTSPAATFPQFDRNPNTGAPFGTTDKVRVAQQTMYHDAERPRTSCCR